MAKQERSAVVGVFSDKSLAQQAVDDLKQAGFASNQIHYADPNDNSKGGFWQGLKSFFSGNRGKSSNQDIENELDDMGLPQNEVVYYEQEYKDGNEVIVVRASGRQAEAIRILRIDGAYNYDAQKPDATGTGKTTTGPTPINSGENTTPVQTNDVRTTNVRPTGTTNPSQNTTPVESTDVRTTNVRPTGTTPTSDPSMTPPPSQTDRMREER